MCLRPFRTIKRRTLVTMEFRLLNPDLLLPLTTFFEVLRTNADDRYFHPHPFTAGEAVKRCHYAGKDLYYVLLESGRVLGYGMLRGWDEGYSVPSLGIAIHPDVRKIGLGQLFMQFLHCVAKHSGAKKIRLKVDSSNLCALNLYRQFGYCFEADGADQLIGWKILK